jgi:hypothetical protein
MAALTDVETTARNYLRDFPRFFQLDFDATGRTFDLGHPNIDSTKLWAATHVSGTTTQLTSSQYSLDDRNGLFRLATATASNTKLLIEGYYFEWLLPADLTFYATLALNQHLHTMDMDKEQLSSVVKDVIGIDAMIESLWGLMTEYSRDIDITTSEAVHIPTSQRFRMVQQLLQYWTAEYEKKARALNIGLDRIEVFNLRRTSRTTNRLVPVQKSRELGDYGPIERIYSPIDDGQIVIAEEQDELRTDVFIDGDPPEGYVSGVRFL